MKVRVLVIGAGGFVGRALVASLAQTDWAQPIAASRRHLELPRGVSALHFDARDAYALNQHMGTVDAVVNCVAAGGQAMVDNARALVRATSTLAHIPHLVHLSSMSVYGSSTGLVDESAPMHDDLSSYGAAKIQAEQELASYPGGAAVLRPGCIYGPGSTQWSSRIAGWLQARRVGDLGKAGDGFCNVVHIDDVIQAISQVLPRPETAGQAYNLAEPGLTSWNDYFVAYGRALATVPIARISSRHMWCESHLYAVLLKLAELAAGGRRSWLPEPIVPSLFRLWSQSLQLDVQKATCELGIEWTPLKAGLQETAAWVQAQRLGQKYTQHGSCIS